MLSKIELLLSNSKSNKAANLQKIEEALSQLKKTKIRIVIETESEDVVRLKKRYFAMVTELGKWIGYQSYSDRQLFKEQIKKELGSESIADMVTVDEIRTKIEELHQFAAMHYNYIFITNEPDIFKTRETGD